MSKILKCPSGHERKIPDDWERDTASCNYCDHVFRLRRPEPVKVQTKTPVQTAPEPVQTAPVPEPVKAQTTALVSSPPVPDPVPAQIMPTPAQEPSKALPPAETPPVVRERPGEALAHDPGPVSDKAKDLLDRVKRRGKIKIRAGS